MEKIYTKARAKINLNLEIIEKRPDNYHNIHSIFQKINFYDELYIEKNNTNTIEISTNVEKLKKDNIIIKAYEILKEKYNISGIHVTLIKNIPTEAGLAGGSTDCASFILAINKLFNLHLSKNEVEKIGKSLGADVIPCFYNNAIQVEGIGDIISPINTKFKYYLIIIKPPVSYSTKEMYQKIDSREMIFDNSRTYNIKQALELNDIDKLTKNLYNRFEEVVPDLNIINTIKQDLLNQKAVR